ncbi:MAG: hypothetical protein PHT24_06320 [Endomicrobiaceae bacterium]|jgi:hypothetical protein|nr:hypothetical protein [Endomicrobiaceae bacterium]
MAVTNTYTKDLMEAYFKGGNAKDKNSEAIRSDLKAIQEIAEKEKEN